MLLAVVVTVLALHLVPDLVLVTRTGDTVAHDARLNFLSELARTQWGSVMTGCFVGLGVATGLTASAFAARQRRWIALAVFGMAVVITLLAVFPTDLNDFRYATMACDEVDRIESCTWVGRVHDVLPVLLVPLAAFVGIALLRAGASWRRLGWAGAGALAVAIGLASLAYLYVQHTTAVPRPWVGLMQRAVVVPALGWLALINCKLVHRARMISGERLGPPGRTTT